MTEPVMRGPYGTLPPAPVEEKSDWKVVLQFFIVPLALVAVLVTVFFGLQVLRSRHPDARAALEDLKSPGKFLLPWVGDPKRWQSGYDLSLLLRSTAGGSALPADDLVTAFRESRAPSGDLKLRRYLALALGRSGDRRAAVVLGEGLDDEDESTRLYCAWGLTELGGPEALARLRGAATHPDPAIRKIAAFGLGQWQDRGAASILHSALADANEDVRVNAAIALARLGDAGGEPAIVAFLASRTADGVSLNPAEEDAVLNAIRALALLKGGAARTALSGAAAWPGSARVRATARLALETIDAEARRALP